jgi:hypothetical protein
MYTISPNAVRTARRETVIGPDAGSSVANHVDARWSLCKYAVSPDATSDSDTPGL